MSLQLLIFAGLSAVGKSTLAGRLRDEYGYEVFDKDDPSFEGNKIINQRLEEHKKTGIDFWRTDEAKLDLEPKLYREMFEKAGKVLTEGKNVIIDGPLLYESKNPDYLAQIREWVRADQLGVNIRFFWFTAAPEKIRTIMFARNADRDHAKLRHEHAWENYIEGIDFDFTPAFEHEVIDVTEKSADEVFADFKAKLAL